MRRQLAQRDVDIIALIHELTGGVQQQGARILLGICRSPSAFYGNPLAIATRLTSGARLGRDGCNHVINRLINSEQ